MACFSVRGACSSRVSHPGVSILMLTGMVVAAGLSGKYDELFNFVIFGSWILYAMATASVFVLRTKRPDLPGRTKRLAIRWYRYCFLLGARCWKLVP